MKFFIGTKEVYAAPMNRQMYNDYRKWELPEDENGADEGYLVEYPDGGNNHPDHAGYISWSPKKQFEEAYTEIGSSAMKEPMLQFFQYQNLSADLQKISKPFAQMAYSIAASLPRNPERTSALRKLLEAKDCAVRAHLYRTTNVS